MSVTITNLPNSRVEVRGEIAADDFSRAVQKVTARIVADAEIEGFRRGKAPEKLVLERISEDGILHQSAEEALKHEWPKVLEENKIEAIGPAEFHIIKIARGNPLEWLARVAVVPSVTLGDYREIAKKVNGAKDTSELEVTDKEVAETLEYIHKSRVRKQKSDAPSMPLDDEFAKSLGNFSTLTALKENIRDGLRLEKTGKRDESHRIKIVESITEKVAIDIPDIMIGTEREKMTQELRASVEDMGLAWKDYLAHVKKTEDELKESWLKDAERRVRVALVLREIAREENIEANDAEISKRVEHMLGQYSEADRAQIDQERVRDYAKGIVRNEKVLDFLEKIQ